MIRGRPILRFSLRGSGASGEGIQKGQENTLAFCSPLHARRIRPTPEKKRRFALGKYFGRTTGQRSFPFHETHESTQVRLLRNALRKANFSN